MRPVIEGMIPERIVVVDVHRRGAYPYVILDAERSGGKWRGKILKVDNERMYRFFEEADPLPDIVIFESTGVKYSAFLQGILEEKQIPFVIMGSRELKAVRDRMMQMGRKSDEVDVKGMLEAIVEWFEPRVVVDGEEERPKIVVPIPPEAQRMRMEIHERERWDKEIARYLNRVEKDLAVIGIRERLNRGRNLKRFLKALREKIEENIREQDGETWYNGWRLGEIQKAALEELRFLLSDPWLDHVELLQERKKDLEKRVIQKARGHKYYPSLVDIKGVGDWTAAVLIAWIWDVRRFRSPSGLKHYLKILGKRYDASGGSKRRKKNGPRIPIIKKTLYMIMLAPRDERLQAILDFYRRHGTRNIFGHPRNPRWVAIGKWLERMFYVWKSIEEGNPEARLKMPRPWKGWRKGVEGAKAEAISRIERKK